MRPSYRQLVIQLIRENRLDERISGAAGILTAAETGKLPEALCRGQYIRFWSLVQQELDRPNLLPPPPRPDQLYAKGAFPIEYGTLAGTTTRIGLHLDPMKHVLAVGQTRSGKTTFLRCLIRALDRHAKSVGRQIVVIVLDPKVDYADLRELLGTNWSHVELHSGKTRINLAPPFGTRLVDAWIDRVAAILAKHLNLVASKSCLTNILRFAVPFLNPQPADELLFPDPALLLEIMTEVPLECWASKPDYGKTLIQALEELALSGGEALRAFRGLDVVHDAVRANQSLVIETANLPDTFRSILIDLLFTQVLFHRLETQRKTEQTEIVLVADEADTELAEASDRAYAGMSRVTRFLKEGRELGCTGVLGVASLEKLSHLGLQSIGCHVMFNQARPESRREAAHTLGLPPSAEGMLLALETGESVVLNTMSSWVHPVLVKNDYIAPNRTPRQAYDSLPFVPARSLSELSEMREALARRAAELLQRSVAGKRRGESALTKRELRFLNTVAANRAHPVARIWAQLDDIGPAAQTAIRKKLQELKLADFEELRINSRNVLFVDLLPAGAEQLGIQHDPLRGRGGVAHRTIADWLTQLAKRHGLEAALEHEAAGTRHPIDVATKDPDGRFHAYEIVCKCETNAISHVQACLIHSTAISQVTFVVPVRSVQNEITSCLQAEASLAPVLNRVNFRFVIDIMKELFP
jgi:hypothetical protein